VALAPSRATRRRCALTCDLCAATECPGARRTARPLLQARSSGCVTASGRAGGGCGVTARRQRPAPVRSYAEAAGQAAAHSGETPRDPGHLRRGTARAPNATSRCCPRPPHEPGLGRTAWRAEGVPLSTRFRVHDLRHTAASLMIQAGYPPKMLQEIMDHASITTTLDLYGHLYPGDMDRYADRLDSAADTTDPAKIRPDDDEGGPVRE
jgi:hypothetical protein